MALGQETLGLRLLSCRRDKIRDCAQGLKTHFWNMSPDQLGDIVLSMPLLFRQ